MLVAPLPGVSFKNISRYHQMCPKGHHCHALITTASGKGIKILHKRQVTDLSDWASLLCGNVNSGQKQLNTNRLSSG